MTSSRSRTRERTLRATLLLVTVAIFLIALEIAARVIREQQGGGKEEQEQTRYNEYDPLLGWRKKANTVVRYGRREYRTEVSINSKGLRDAEREIDPPEGVFRVLALGDSFIEGYTVEWPETLGQRLEAGLKAIGCASDVINAGTAGYSTDQETLFYMSEGARYRAPLVLLFFHYNDILFTDRQDYFGSPKPEFEAASGALKLHRYPVRERPKTTAPAPATPEEPAGSAALELLRDRLWYGAPKAHDALARLGLWNPIPRTTARMELLAYDRRSVEPIEDAWSKVEAVLALLKEQVHARGARLGIVYVPSKMEVQDASWRTTKQLYRLNEDSWDRGKVQAHLSALASSLDAPVLDLTPPLRSGETWLASTYFMVDGHWNARGHQVAAQALLDWMKAGGFTPRACGGSLPRAAPRGGVWSPEPGNAISLPRGDTPSSR